MPATDPEEELLSIGEFSRLSGLTPKALRIYHRDGLLCPAEVDSTSGYRYYRRSQLLAGRLIGMLRGIELSLSEIKMLMADLPVDRALVTARLSRHLDRLEAEHSGRRFLLHHIQTIVRKEDDHVFPVHTRHVPAQRVMSIQRRLLADQTDGFLAEVKEKFTLHLNGREPIGPFVVIFHGIVDSESDGPIEAILGCPDEVEATDEIGIRTEPAHEQAFTTITKAQWEFPAILAAYDAVACSPQALERPGSSLSCREMYLTEPESIGPDDRICDIAFPLGPDRS